MYNISASSSHPRASQWHSPTSYSMYSENLIHWNLLCFALSDLYIMGEEVLDSAGCRQIGKVISRLNESRIFFYCFTSDTLWGSPSKFHATLFYSCLSWKRGDSWKRFGSGGHRMVVIILWSRKVLNYRAVSRADTGRFRVDQSGWKLIDIYSLSAFCVYGDRRGSWKISLDILIYSWLLSFLLLTKSSSYLQKHHSLSVNSSSRYWNWK